LYCEHAIKDITEKNSVSSDKISSSLRVWHLISIIVFCPLPDSAQSGGQFSQVHYYSLGWPYMPNFIKISQAIFPPGYTEQNCRQTHRALTLLDRKTENKSYLAVPIKIKVLTNDKKSTNIT